MNIDHPEIPDATPQLALLSPFYFLGPLDNCTALEADTHTHAAMDGASSCEILSSSVREELLHIRKRQRLFILVRRKDDIVR